MPRVFSTKHRPSHLGPYPLEALPRQEALPDLGALAAWPGLRFESSDPVSIIPAMGEYQAMLDATRTGQVKSERAIIPDDPEERARHLKGFGYYCDAGQVGICRIPASAWRADPLENPDVARLADKINTMQVKTFAAGVDVIMAGLKEALAAPARTCQDHAAALIFLYEYPRDPGVDEIGAGWIQGAQAHRACLRGAETAVTLATYLRLLGYDARAHSMAASDVYLERLAVAAGLAWIDDGAAVNPFHGRRFGLAAVTTDMEIAPDKPLKPNATPPIGWATGLGRHARNAKNADPFAKRRFADGPHPFERLKRVETPTTHIDAENVARVPKRANMFARALFGDFGKKPQEAARNGNYVRKSAAAFAFRPSLGAFILLQSGEAAPVDDFLRAVTDDAERNAANIKAAAYFLGADAVGLSACPDYAYYSHDAAGEVIDPYHDNAISIIIDQGFETMEGASGDDWIACAQSMRAYLRFSLIGGVLGTHLRNLGHPARVHSVMDDEVLNPPLLLLAGLGEVSRIGEVILNPFLGPRLKSGVVTTTMKMAHDRPIDFGLQRFCDSCNKCARECPSGAITAGPKLMFNGYEIWKSDSQKCLTYRVAQDGGAMCGRCMKTCPWNLEGLFAEAPFRWLATHLPGAAKPLARLDDWLGNGEINPVKTWWWDLEMIDEGPYAPPAHPVNRRGLSKDLDLKYEDQTLAVYPANLAPPPYAWPFPADREAGIQAYREMIGADEYRTRRARGLAPEHVYTADRAPAPVLSLVIARVEKLTEDVTLYEFAHPDGAALPAFEAGAHIDVVVAPEFFRQFSLSGDPADRSRYQIAIKREDKGRGGSKLAHRIFSEGRRVFVSHPINHFPLVEDARQTLLFGGGIGVTPMIAMAHRLHALGRDFTLHFSAPTRARAPFLERLAAMPWADKVAVHISAEGTRANLGKLLNYKEGSHVYTCGPEAYMNAVTAAAAAGGYPEEAIHLEYFTLPEEPEYENHAFTLKLARSGREITVGADQAATDALLEAGVRVDVKCADGLCGVCKCQVLSGEVEHRDYVLSRAQREHAMILCRSRAAEPQGVIEIDL